MRSRRCTFVSPGCIRLTRQDVIESSTPLRYTEFSPDSAKSRGSRRGHACRNWLGSAHLKRAWMCVRQMRPPGRGDFWILKIAHGPSDKNLSKNGSAHKGGSLSVKDVIAKKFLVPGEDSAVGASASIYGSSAATGRGSASASGMADVCPTASMARSARTKRLP
jgi:hypothetical protein